MADLLEVPVVPATEQIVGTETTAEARLAVAAVLQRKSGLAELLERAVIQDSSDRPRPIRTCPHCAAGRLHTVGRQKLPDGRPGLAAIVVCDTCGYYDGRR